MGRHRFVFCFCFFFTLFCSIFFFRKQKKLKTGSRFFIAVFVSLLFYFLSFLLFLFFLNPFFFLFCVLVVSYRISHSCHFYWIWTLAMYRVWILDNHESKQNPSIQGEFRLFRKCLNEKELVIREI